MTETYRQVFYIGGPLDGQSQKLTGREMVRIKEMPIEPNLARILPPREDIVEPEKLRVAEYEKFELSDGVVRYWYLGKR
jgi:hypothetical protein